MLNNKWKVLIWNVRVGSEAPSGESEWNGAPKQDLWSYDSNSWEAEAQPQLNKALLNILRVDPNVKIAIAIFVNSLVFSTIYFKQ